MRLYSEVLEMPKDHRLRSKWVLEADWSITKVSQLNEVINKLDEWTGRDNSGRVLCVGSPSEKMELQDRVYVVKMGHDGNLFRQFTPRYDELRNKLKM
jgi:hypothetical protein